MKGSYQPANNDNGKFESPPKGLHRLILTSFPEGINQQELQSWLKSHPKGSCELQGCRWRSDFDIPSFEILVNDWTYHLLTSECFEHHFYSMIVLEQHEPSTNLLRSLSRYQLKVTCNRSMNLLSIYNYFKRCGKLAYVL